MTHPFREYRVTRKVVESSIITSFLLRAEDGTPPRFWPGEYLLFELLDDGADGVVIQREYSISGVVDGAMRVTIKREPAAQGHPPGRGSAHFHDRIEVGSRVRAAGPFGQFRLDRKSHRHAVLLSGGVGLTPLVAMAHDLAGAGKPFTFIHACEDGAVHAMGAEIRALARGCPGMTTHFCYRKPRPEDVPLRDYDSIGFLSAGTLQNLLPLPDCDIYMCGPKPFMQALYDILIALGVANSRIRYEFFGPASLLGAGTGAQTLPQLEQAPGAPIVRFARSGLSGAWDDTAPNLLEFAEDCGLSPDFSCRAGTCESCKVRVLSGAVRYVFQPFRKPGPDEVLVCCSVPTQDLTLDL